MRIHIYYGFMKGPWGGGNQFLKVLRNYLISQDLYEEDPSKATVILFNSYPFREEWRFKRLFKLKQEKKIIHRVDGPISIVRGNGKQRIYDEIIYRINKLVADGTIFQSRWSMERNKQIGMESNKYEAIILNATDLAVFSSKKKFSLGKKVKLMCSSWSRNWKKGFEIYKYLEEHLDFSKYEMSFVGNSPIEFRKIKHTKPVPQKSLAKKLKKHDIFISASIDDPCSNSLIEAISVGLPVIALNSGGNPEILKRTNSGILFNGKEDVIGQIENLVENYLKIVERIRPLNIDEIGKKYVQFIENVEQWKKISEKDAFNFLNYFEKS